MGKELARRRPSPAQKAVEERIRVIRGKQVVLDSDLAAFYGKTQGSRTDPQAARGTRKIHPAFRIRLITAVASNAVMAT